MREGRLTIKTPPKSNPPPLPPRNEPLANQSIITKVTYRRRYCSWPTIEI